MKKIIEIKNLEPFVENESHEINFLNYINYLTKYHYSNSQNYQKILKKFDYNKNKKYSLVDIPFVTTNLFKDLELRSIKKKDIFKTLRSSGTSSQQRSKIYLDKKNANSQRMVLSKIYHYYFGTSRLPMLIVSKNQNKDKLNFDAKTAAIRGFSLFGRNHEYLLDEQNQIDNVKLKNFLKKYGNKKFLIFGFTNDIYQAFFNKLKSDKANINLSNGVMLHGGGWKKLEKIKISNELFKKKFLKDYKLKIIINYYGLIEQVGSIFFECPKCNVFMCTNYSDVMIRDKNLKVKKKGKGFVQLFSLLPKSYPGHNILTEDIGEITSCKCGFKGKCFKIHGRVKNSEIRGCSDV